MYNNVLSTQVPTSYIGPHLPNRTPIFFVNSLEEILNIQLIYPSIWIYIRLFKFKTDTINIFIFLHLQVNPGFRRPLDAYIYIYIYTNFPNAPGISESQAEAACLIRIYKIFNFNTDMSHVIFILPIIIIIIGHIPTYARSTLVYRSPVEATAVEALLPTRRWNISTNKFSVASGYPTYHKCRLNKCRYSRTRIVGGVNTTRIKILHRPSGAGIASSFSYENLAIKVRHQSWSLTHGHPSASFASL